MERDSKHLAQTTKSKKVSSFRARTFVLLGILTLISGVGFVLLTINQERILSLSKSLHSEILPSINLLENVQRELDLQIREIQLVSALGKKIPPTNKAPHLALIRLGPSSRSLLILDDIPKLSPVIKEDIDLWKTHAENYSQKIPSFKTELDALYDLRRLRAQINLSHRKLKNSLSIQLLRLSQNSSKASIYWIAAFSVSFFMLLALLFFLWRWFRPLEEMSAWFRSDDAQKWLPSAELGRGFFAPPREIQDLAKAIQSKVQPLQDFAKKTQLESAEVHEHQRSITFLIAALMQVGKKNEELITQLIAREKMASMGEMAAQLAHEIRNPLNSMNLKLELLLEELPQNNKKSVEAIIDEIDRLDALTESYLRSTRDHIGTPHLSEDKSFSAHNLFEEVTELFQQDIDEKKIRIEFSGEDFEIPLPHSVAKAVLLNLVKNSIEAITPDSKRRVIRAECQHEENSWEFKLLDTGNGFPEEYLSHPFQLFHTSKEKGTGLGLATAKKMLEAYSCEILLLEPREPFCASVAIRPMAPQKRQIEVQVSP